MSTPPAPLVRDAAATAALAAFTLAVAAGFSRVFSGWAFLGDAAVLAAVGHGGSLALRRARVSGWIAVPTVVIALAWTLTMQQYRDTTTWLLPAAATWDRVDLEVGLVRDQFPTAVAPVLYGAGWATLAGVALALAIVLADTFAFRAEARAEALVPGGVLFVFIAALASDRLRVESTVLLVATGVVAVVALRARYAGRHGVELRASRPTASLLVPAALATATVVAVAAGIVGPRIPGAGAEPLYDTRGRGGGVTSVISPLVDIRSRLTNRGDEELFRVRADAPAYWRVTTLPAFDGQRFSLPPRPLDRIAAEAPPALGSIEIRQEIEVRALGGRLVPAAADPIGAEGFTDGERVDLRLNRDTSSLLAPDEIGAGDGFRIVSSRPVLTAELLRSATTAAPPDEIYTELPDDLPDVVGRLAREATAGTETGFDTAIALQSWFRDPDEFRYSLEVQSGHGATAIESFLDQRVGYCEQFAATFATMARTLGIPSRVAVGFTPGVVDDDGRYRVIGKNAHAWPELWFDGIGWVAFEPTPGRGAPGAESYTGLAPAQDETGQDDDQAGDEDDGAGAPSTTAPAVTVPATTPDGTVPPADTVAPTTVLPVPGDAGGPAEPGAGGGAPDTSDGGRSWRMLAFAAALLAALAAPAAARRLSARRSRSAEPYDRVERAWQRATRAAIQAGVTGRDSMTVHEWAAATAAELPVAARPMTALADVVDRVTFGPPETADPSHTGALGHDCERWADQVARIATDTLTGPRRVRRYFTTWS